MELSWSSMLLEMINFLVLVWILKHFFYAPIQQIILKRQTEIQADLDKACQLKKEAGALQKSYENRLLPFHARMMTSLSTGLMHFTYPDGVVEYLACLGGVLYFTQNTLYLCTRQYFRHSDYQHLLNDMEKSMHAHATYIKNMKESLKRFDEEMLKHLWELKRRYHGEF